MHKIQGSQKAENSIKCPLDMIVLLIQSNPWHSWASLLFILNIVFLIFCGLYIASLLFTPKVQFSQKNNKNKNKSRRSSSEDNRRYTRASTIIDPALA